MNRSLLVWLCGASLLALMLAGAAQDEEQETMAEMWYQRLLSHEGSLPETALELSAHRKALAQAVTQMINDREMREQHPEVVGAAMALAGDLQLIGCIPALAENIKFRAVRPSGLISERIEFYPAGLALTRMGFASVPALVSLVKSDDADETTLAIFALCRLPHKNLILDVLKAEQARTTSEVTAAKLASALSIVDTARMDEERLRPKSDKGTSAAIPEGEN